MWVCFLQGLKFCLNWFLFNLLKKVFKNDKKKQQPNKKLSVDKFSHVCFF